MFTKIKLLPRLRSVILFLIIAISTSCSTTPTYIGKTAATNRNLAQSGGPDCSVDLSDDCSKTFIFSGDQCKDKYQSAYGSRSGDTNESNFNACSLKAQNTFLSCFNTTKKSCKNTDTLKRFTEDSCLNNRERNLQYCLSSFDENSKEYNDCVTPIETEYKLCCRVYSGSESCEPK